MWAMNLTFELSEYEKIFLFELFSSSNNNNTIEEKVEKFLLSSSEIRKIQHAYHHFP